MNGPGKKNNYFFFAVLLVACGSKQREQALQRIDSPVAKERVAAVRGLDGNDDASWAALVKAARDGSAAVRTEAAASMARSSRGEAADAIASLLRDPDDSVRLAAARALSQKCGERGEAYLRIAFARSDAQVRGQLIESLQACGKPPEDTLAREEAERRRKALALLENPIAAQRARGAHELGLLGREQDHAPLLKLLDDRDGVAVAAAARALGDCGAAEAVPRILPLLDEGGEVAAAAAEALLALHATDAARPQLRKLATADADEALPAALALGPDCAAALQARSARAAPILAQDCPAAPFVRALAGAPNRDALVEALLQAQGPAPELDQTLTQLLRKGDTDPRYPQLALRYHAGGRALVEALQREQAQRAKQIAQQKPPPEADSAAEIAKNAASGTPDKERYAQLMARLKERQGKEEVRSSAAARLDVLLHGTGETDRRDFIAGALRAVQALQAPGAAKVAMAFAQDPDARIAAAARGEPEPETRKPAPVAPLEARVALWSDDGGARARACAATAGSQDASVLQARGALAKADPERRVRAACAAANETQPAK